MNSKKALDEKSVTLNTHFWVRRLLNSRFVRRGAFGGCVPR